MSADRLHDDDTPPYQTGNFGLDRQLYMNGQLAAAVLDMQERCAKVLDDSARECADLNLLPQAYYAQEIAARIRGLK